MSLLGLHLISKKDAGWLIQILKNRKCKIKE